ncbi:MAG TPA: xanthine dehydrogenase family protein molybdopterin-binding subunit [Xanthobacteraceae bacterium]|nr:xanthine dehydrogenase family protein molybdopterin-binding subunit [Xanthobacteraceae bacterium]
MNELIGARVLRLEDHALLTGTARFVDDIAAPGALHAAFVRSAHPHALIRGVDAAAARAMPGIVAVLTLDDLAPVLKQRRMMRVSNSGTKLDQSWPFALADGEVSFVGEPVAIVIASDRYVAEDAAALVAVDYDVLPAATDCRTAARGPAARRELAGNEVIAYTVAYGDAAAAFAKAAHVVHEDLWIHRGAAHSMEGRGILVQISDREMVVWASTQKAHDLRNALADYIALDDSRLRVATPDVGGGFGPKLCVYPEDVAVVAAATLLRRSVKWIEDRREHFTNAAQERDQYWSIEIAADGDGRVRGVRGRLTHDLGAYALQDVNIPYNSATTLTGPYMVPALAIDVAVIHTNKAPVSSVRGAGYPQAAFAMERLMDRLAQAIGVERAELRRRNLIPAEKMPYLKPLKARSGEQVQYDSGDYPGCQAEILRAAGWDDFPRRQAAARQQGRYLGIGLAHGIKGTGRGPFEFGGVKVSPTGRITVSTGAAAMGQGLATALAQICAQAFGVRAEDVTVVSGDTAAAPLGLGGFASRQTVTAGSSVQIAAKAVAAKAKKLASHMLEAAEDDLEVVDGEVRVVGAPQLSVKLGELARILKGAPGYAFPQDIDPGLEASATFRVDQLAYSNACHVVEVEVDIETGGVAFLRYLAIQDSGRRVNPQIVEGQVHGGIAHGIGNAILEWMGYDAAGQPVTTTFADYLLPTATDVPAFETLYKESPSPHNPLGVKGVGEVGVIPAAAAVISAIEDALSPFAVRIAQMPITPHKLVELIAQGTKR